MPSKKKTETYPKTLYVKAGGYSDFDARSKVTDLLEDFDLSVAEGSVVGVYELKGTKKVTVILSE